MFGRMNRNYDTVVVGGGPAGLGAALGALESGVSRVLIVERDAEPGGILRQCIHSGFGLHHFKEELTGPEYAARFIADVIDHDIDVAPMTYVTGMGLDTDGLKHVRVLSERGGVGEISCRSVVLAMGCRERTRGAIRIPGSRPSGVLTAGLAQKLVNLEGYIPGHRVAILGSGDIGLIMARRLTLEGCEVVGVFELMPYSNGLTRNVVQCLNDYNIPLHLATTVTAIRGKDRVEGIQVAPVDDHLRPMMDRAYEVDCDTLLLSIGLIPENELSKNLGVKLDLTTGGPVVSSIMETSMPGVFACGNVLHVHDLVDYVTAESLRAGRFAGELAKGYKRPEDRIKLLPGKNVRYCVPHTICPGREHTVFMRCTQHMKPCVLRVGDLYEKKLRCAIPAEMISIKLTPDMLDKFNGNQLSIDIVPANEGAKE